MIGSGSPSQKLKPPPTRNYLKGRLHKYFTICSVFFQGVVTKKLKGMCIMIMKELKYEEFEPLRQQLIKRAFQNPMEYNFNVDMTVDKIEYRLKVQPDNGYKIFLLQAFKVIRDEHRQVYEPIVKKSVLTSLLELLVWQGVA